MEFSNVKSNPFSVCSYNRAYNRNYIEKIHFPIAQSNVRHDIHISFQNAYANAELLAQTELRSPCYQHRYTRVEVFAQMFPLQNLIDTLTFSFILDAI